jgi:hypothetical protein
VRALARTGVDAPVGPDRLLRAADARQRTLR